MRALIKESGEILDIKSHHILMGLKFNINTDNLDESHPLKKSELYTHNSNSTKKYGTYYILSDGNEYHIDQLIIGDENIRNEKINEII